MPKYLSHIINGEHFTVSSDRGLFWENEKTLIIADLHIGKTGHFRKEGINVPQSVYKDDLHRLLAQILFFKAERLIIVGDLTHSKANRELELFCKWRHDFSLLNIDLVKGNHDILEDAWYEEANINVHHGLLNIQPFTFIHDITAEKIKTDHYAFSGHVHPAVVLTGKARQSARFPCFYFTKKFCILPAYSRFTGGYKVSPSKNDNVFALTEKEIFPV